MKSSFCIRIYLSVISMSIMISLQAQSLKNLDENNGFKKYKLGSKFVMGYGVKHKDTDGADKIVIDYLKETIGDIPVKAVELYYLRDTLAKIIVKVFQPETACFPEIIIFIQIWRKCGVKICFCVTADVLCRRAK